MNDNKSKLDVARKIFSVTNPLLSAIVEITIDSALKTDDVSKSGELDKIREEAQRQSFALKMAETQAKVAQEIAIAKRIETAEEVEIEEFYDNSAEGSVGLSSNGESLNLGLTGKGSRVVKRLYRFKGSNS
jgi:hypothetical protein